MRRAKIGDVYAVKVPNGYKIIQWAYHIKKYGTFIRVFSGLYDIIPENIYEIVNGQHSYIVDLYVSRAYRLGLLNWIGNYPVPEKYPFPEKQIEFLFNLNGIYGFRIEERDSASCFMHYSDTIVTTIDVLPEQYRDVKRLAHCVSPDWLLYLFDNNFSLHNLDVFRPWLHWGDNWQEKYHVYVDMVSNAVEKDRVSRKSKVE